MLEMKNVVKTFGTFKALDNLSLTVPKGAVYGLVGPNGAGKTTAIRHLAGVYRADSGSVTLDGQPIDENLLAKEKIACVADEPFFFPAANLLDMKRYYAGVYPAFDEKRFEELQDVFQLPRRNPLRRFSKGMQKQAAFHLTLATHAKYLILDEPVDGLDPVMRRQVWSLILDDVAARGQLPQPAGAGGHLRPCGHHAPRQDAGGAEPGGYAGQHRKAANGGTGSPGADRAPQNILRTAEYLHHPGLHGPGAGGGGAAKPGVF